MFAFYASMTTGEHGAASALEASPGDAWAELCGFGGEDDEEPEDRNPGYASLMGLGARKPRKQPVLVLDPAVAEKAAQVMEINAGQLVVNPDKPVQGFAWPGLDEEEEPFDAREEEYEDEDAQAAQAPVEHPEPAWWGTMEDPAEPFLAPPVIELSADEEWDPTLALDEPSFDLPALERAVTEATPADEFAGHDAPASDDVTLAPPEPEAPRHELRLLVSRRARPRISRTPRLRVWARRIYRLVRQILA